jgi:hypothetical protein
MALDIDERHQVHSNRDREEIMSSSESTHKLTLTLSRWENEGGELIPTTDEPRVNIADLTNPELVHLRTRLIALENLMIAILAEGSDRQRELACDIAAYISPRPGFVHHPLTVKAADHVNDLVQRAVQLRAERM